MAQPASAKKSTFKFDSAFQFTSSPTKNKSHIGKDDDAKQPEGAFNSNLTVVSAEDWLKDPNDAKAGRLKKALDEKILSSPSAWSFGGRKKSTPNLTGNVKKINPFNMPDVDDFKLPSVDSSSPSPKNIATARVFTLPHNAKRVLARPKFERVNAIQQELESLRHEIERKLQQQSKLTEELKPLEKETTKWHAQFAKWNADDFLLWVTRIEDVNVVGPEFVHKLNAIARRVTVGWSLSEVMFQGKHLTDFDLLDVSNLFTGLDRNGCRKVFAEIEKLTRKAKEQVQSDHLCSICVTNKRNLALACGHVFCEQCVQRIDKCAFCKTKVRKRKARMVFL